MSNFNATPSPPLYKITCAFHANFRSKKKKDLADFSCLQINGDREACVILTKRLGVFINFILIGHLDLRFVFFFGFRILGVFDF